MKRFIILTLMQSLILGCASQAVLQQKRSEYQRTIPTCQEDRECELKWSAARRWVINNSSRKIQHITNDFIETYNPEQYSVNIAVRVVKEPLSAGGYQFIVTVWCANMFGCQPDQWDAAINFNRYVTAATR